MRNLLAREVGKAGGQRAYGRKIGMSAAYIGMVLAGEKPGPGILLALGLEITSEVTTYKRKRG